MLLEDVFKFYGNALRAAKAIGISRSAVSLWEKQGYIPYLSQKRFEKKTEGRLEANEQHATALCNDKRTNKAVFYPAYRYHDPDYGLCPVYSITFYANRAPKITYLYSEGDARKRLVSYDQRFLMASLDALDVKGQRLFVGDYVQFDNKKKIRIDGISQMVYDELNRHNSFTIIGNIYDNKGKK